MKFPAARMRPAALFATLAACFIADCGLLLRARGIGEGEVPNVDAHAGKEKAV